MFIIRFIKFTNCRGRYEEPENRIQWENLSILDFFSRFHWVVPLPSKLSRRVKSELKKIFEQHGNPRTF